MWLVAICIDDPSTRPDSFAFLTVCNQWRPGAGRAVASWEQPRGKQLQRIMDKLRGTIEKVFYAGPKFSAGRLRGADGRSHSFAGNLFATEGQHVALAGAWETHPDYGRQFKVERVEIEMPAGAEGLAQFIANHPELKGDRADTGGEDGEDFEATLLDPPGADGPGGQGVQL